MASSASGGAELIGRQYELADLQEALRDALAGHGQTVLVSGEPGIGKTRLVEAAVETAALTTARVVWGRCWEGGGASAYWPWVQVLRGCSGDGTVPQLAPLLDGRSAASAASADARAAVFEAVASYLEEQAAEAPLVVALDDLHAADDASLQLLMTVARAAGRAALLVLGTYREAEVVSSPPRRRLLQAVAAHGRELRLGGLDTAGVVTLLERAGLADAALARRVHATTDGNPFFVKEMARLVLAGADTRSMSLPEEVHALIRRRLEPVDDELRRVLGLASVLGRDFEVAALGRVAALPPQRVLDLLGGASTVGVAHEVALSRWSFAHALLRETLYDELSDDERTDAHRRAGEAIEVHHASEIDDHLAALAHHFTAAGDVGRAVDYGGRAGAQAMAMLAYEEAAALYGRALDALSRHPEADDRRHFELLLGASSALLLTGELAEARAAAQRALKLARRLQSGELLARAVLALVGFGGPGAAELVSLLDEALQALPPGDSALKAQVLLKMSWVDDQLTAFREIAERSRQGLQMARRVGDPALLRKAMFQWVQNSFIDLDALDDRIRVASELVELEERAGDRSALILARAMLAGSLLYGNDAEAARAQLALLAGEARALHNPMFAFVATYERAYHAFTTGRIDEGERLAHEALALGEQSGWGGTAFVSTDQTLLAHLLRGRFAEAVELCRAALGQHPLPSAPVDCLSVQGALALAQDGRHAEAHAELHRLVDEGLTLERFGLPRLCCLAQLAETCWILDDRAPAEMLYERLAPYAGRQACGPDVRSNGAVDRYLGQLAALLRHYEHADAHFEAAHRLHDRLGARPWEAHTKADHARMLLARGEPGNRGRAVDLLDAAGEEYRSLGMHVYAERAETALRSAANAARLRSDEDGWEFCFDENTVRVRDSKGVRYLAELLRNPAVEFNASRLVGEVDPQRARHAATRALKGAIDRLAAADPALGAHLRATIRIGTISSYQPDPRTPLVWTE